MYKLLISTLLASLVFAFIAVVTPVRTHALLDSSKQAVCTGINLNSSSTTCDPDAETKANSTLKKAINLVSSIVGIISVIMIMVGGIKYMTSGGDSNNVNSAKNTIIYALIGVVVTVLAQVFVRFVLNRFTI